MFPLSACGVVAWACSQGKVSFPLGVRLESSIPMFVVRCTWSWGSALRSTSSESHTDIQILSTARRLALEYKEIGLVN